MRYEISGTTMQTVAVDLNAGETLFRSDELHGLDVGQHSDEHAHRRRASSPASGARSAAAACSSPTSPPWEPGTLRSRRVFPALSSRAGWLPMRH